MSQGLAFFRWWHVVFTASAPEQKPDHPIKGGGGKQVEDLHKASGLDLKYHQATRTFGQCALGFSQVKAAGLVEVYDLKPHCPAFFG